MNIGQASDATGLPAKTIRYYEDIGLVKPPRDANGYRAFRESDLHKLAFLARARALGFSIEDCRVLVGAFHPPMDQGDRIATKPGDQIIFPDHSGKSFTGKFYHLVAKVMAVTVVNFFKVVQVNEQ